MVKDLIRVGKKLESLNLVIGEGGNISAREGKMLYVKKKGAIMSKGNARDYVRVGLKTGKAVKGQGEASSEVYLHLACYRSRRDIGAVVHTHPVFSTALSINNVKLKPLTYEMATNLQSLSANIGYIEAGSQELARAVGNAVKRNNAVLLKNHGLVTVGRTIEEAFMRTLAFERAAMAYVICKVLGKVTFLSPGDYKRFFQKL